jgi:hypothetical protein
MISLIAQKLYERTQNSFMPPWDQAPTVYAYGFLNDAYAMLEIVEQAGMLPPSKPTGWNDYGDEVFENKWTTEVPDLIRADLGENASSNYKDDLFGGRIEDENE